MKSQKIECLVVVVACCVVIWSAGCRRGTGRAAPAVEPGEQPPAVQTAAQRQAEKGEPVDLTLRYTAGDSTTYNVITGSEKSVLWQGPAGSQPSAFKGGHTGNRVKMTFTQLIKSVEDGAAVAEITIKGLRYSARVKDDVVVDFDSSRPADVNSPLAGLIGQSYTIELSPGGEVTKIVETDGVRVAVAGGSSAHKAALMLVSDEFIRQRHEIAAIPDDNDVSVYEGDKWSNVKTFSFGMMGSEAYERDYTLTKVEDANDRRIAVVEMEAVPSSEMATEMHRQQATNLFSKMFDSTGTYRGRLEMDLKTGKVRQYYEDLSTEWLAVDPAAAQGDEEPAALKMAATRLHRIEMVGYTDPN